MGPFVVSVLGVLDWFSTQPICKALGRNFFLARKKFGGENPRSGYGAVDKRKPVAEAYRSERAREPLVVRPVPLCAESLALLSH